MGDAIDEGDVGYTYGKEQVDGTLQGFRQLVGADGEILPQKEYGSKTTHSGDTLYITFLDGTSSILP